MLNINHHYCLEEGCNSIRSFGVPGTRNPEFCDAHKLKGMVDVVNFRCGRGARKAAPCLVLDMPISALTLCA